MMGTALISACCLSADERTMTVHFNTVNTEESFGEKKQHSLIVIYTWFPQFSHNNYIILYCIILMFFYNSNCNNYYYYF